jgi:hypothetical protein
MDPASHTGSAAQRAHDIAKRLRALDDQGATTAPFLTEMGIEA